MCERLIEVGARVSSGRITELLRLRSRAESGYGMAVARAHGGLHEAIAEAVSTFVEPASRILDVGAGTGALSLRLRAMGHLVEAVELDPGDWAADDIPVQMIDLNEGLPARLLQASFDAVCCVEVVEHVNDPFRLLRELYCSLRPGGTLVLSTPNVASFASRARFLLEGELLGFDDATVVSMHHVMPIHPFQLRYATRVQGWEVVEQSPAGKLALIDLSGVKMARILRRIVFSMACLAVYPISRGEERRGRCIVLVLRRPLDD